MCNLPRDIIMSDSRRVMNSHLLKSKHLTTIWHSHLYVRICICCKRKTATYLFPNYTPSVVLILEDQHFILGVDHTCTKYTKLRIQIKYLYKVHLLANFSFDFLYSSFTTLISYLQCFIFMEHLNQETNTKTNTVFRFVYIIELTASLTQSCEY